MVSGSCLCGGITFTLTGPLRDVVHCHCTQCRKTSGHHWAATRVSDTQITFTAQDTLTWFQSSACAKRGFCNRCGASVFYRHQNDDGPAIGAGCLDAPTGLATAKHIYCASKGDYYDIAPEAPQL